MFIRNYFWNSQFFRRRCCAFVVFISLFLLFGSGCSPRLNWRILNSEHQFYEALFPDKPHQVERQIFYQKYQLNEFLEATRVGDDIYSIATISLVPGLADQAEQLASYLLQAVIQNTNIYEKALIRRESIYRLSGSRADHFPVSDYFVAFKLRNGDNQLMRVRWIIRRGQDGITRIYQVTLLRSHTEWITDSSRIFFILSQEGVELFFDGFHPS